MTRGILLAVLLAIASGAYAGQPVKSTAGAKAKQVEQKKEAVKPFKKPTRKKNVKL